MRIWQPQASTQAACVGHGIAPLGAAAQAKCFTLHHGWAMPGSATSLDPLSQGWETSGLGAEYSPQSLSTWIRGFSRTTLPLKLPLLSPGHVSHWPCFAPSLGIFAWLVFRIKVADRERMKHPHAFEWQTLMSLEINQSWKSTALNLLCN